MADTGPIFPSAASSAAEAPWSGADWINQSNITSCDGSSAECTSGGGRSYVLYAQSFDFSGLPDGATIDGVEFTLLWLSGAGLVTCTLIQLTDTDGPGHRVGTNQAGVGMIVPITWTAATVGSSIDTWGCALTTAWLKDPDFSIGIGGFLSGLDTFYIDCVNITIYYTSTSGGIGVISSRATECRSTRNSTRRPVSRG